MLQTAVSLRPLPVPTLYSGSSPDSKLKFSCVELLIYNMAAMAASIAAGYDVRLSNVTAVHPKLLPVKLVTDFIEFYFLTVIN